MTVRPLLRLFARNWRFLTISDAYEAQQSLSNTPQTSWLVVSIIPPNTRLKNVPGQQSGRYSAPEPAHDHRAATEPSTESADADEVDCVAPRRPLWMAAVHRWTRRAVGTPCLPCGVWSFCQRKRNWRVATLFLKWAGEHFHFPGIEFWTRKPTIKIPHSTRQPWWTVHRPHSSMNGRHSEQPLRCAATYLVGGLSGLVWWRRGGRGRLGGWVAVALLSPARVFALYGVEYWKYPLNQPDECFRGSVEPHMHRISSGIVRIERRGGEVVEL